MTFVALILCLLITAIVAVGVVSPSRLLRILRKAQKPRGLLLLGILRVVLGIALIFSAPASRAPGFLGIAGVIVIIRGVILPFIGVERVRRILDRLAAQGSTFIRGWALLAMVVLLWVVIFFQVRKK